MKSIVRGILVLAMIIEAVVVLGHFGDLEIQSFGEWFVLEVIAVAVSIGTAVLFRYVGSHWEQMSVPQKVLTAAPVLASLWFIGPAVAMILLVIGAVALLVYSVGSSFPSGLFGSSGGGANNSFGSATSNSLGSWWDDEKVLYDHDGRPIWIGDRKVVTDAHGKPISIGNQRVVQDSSGNPAWVDGDRVVRGSDGRPTWVGDRKVQP